MLTDVPRNASVNARAIGVTARLMTVTGTRKTGLMLLVWPVLYKPYSSRVAPTN